MIEQDITDFGETITKIFDAVDQLIARPSANELKDAQKAVDDASSKLEKFRAKLFELSGAIGKAKKIRSLVSRSDDQVVGILESNENSRLSSADWQLISNLVQSVQAESAVTGELELALLGSAQQAAIFATASFNQATGQESAQAFAMRNISLQQMLTALNTVRALEISIIDRLVAALGNATLP